MTTPKAAFDVIVIGAGIEGSSCAYSIVKEGKKVLLLEQFPLPHTRGSSHGQSRITRYAYQDEFYVRMMVDAFPLWAQLEKESESDFFINCGLLDLYVDNSPSMKRVISSLRNYDIPHEVLSSKELGRRYPMITAGSNCTALWDHCGGLLRANKALLAYQNVFKQRGGVIHDNEPVTSVIPGNMITVVTNRSIYTSQSVVIAAGAWSGPLCSTLGLQLPLQVRRIPVFYWRATDEWKQAYESQNFPCLIDSRYHNGFHTYGIPTSEYPGLVKVCPHGGPGIDPDERDNGTKDKWTEEKTIQGITTTFLGLAKAPSIKEYCIYTETPDNHPFIDRHPKFANVVIATGFSGHGFKLAPAVGKAVTELVLGKEQSYNMQPFRIDRFSSKSNL